MKVNYFTQEHNRMTQLGLEPRPPRPGIHCTDHYATATKAFPLYTFYSEFEDKNFLKR